MFTIRFVAVEYVRRVAYVAYIERVNYLRDFNIPLRLVCFERPPSGKCIHKAMLNGKHYTFYIRR